MKTSLIKCQIGDPIQEIRSGRQGILKSIILKPNGMSSPELIAVLVVHFDDGRRISATSDKFTVVEDFEYTDSYMSDGL